MTPRAVAVALRLLPCTCGEEAYWRRTFAEHGLGPLPEAAREQISHRMECEKRHAGRRPAGELGGMDPRGGHVVVTPPDVRAAAVALRLACTCGQFRKWWPEWTRIAAERGDGLLRLPWLIAHASACAARALAERLSADAARTEGTEHGRHEDATEEARP